MTDNIKEKEYRGTRRKVQEVLRRLNTKQGNTSEVHSSGYNIVERSDKNVVCITNMPLTCSIRNYVSSIHDSSIWNVPQHLPERGPDINVRKGKLFVLKLNLIGHDMACSLFPRFESLEPEMNNQASRVAVVNQIARQLMHNGHPSEKNIKAQQDKLNNRQVEPFTDRRHTISCHTEAVA